VLVHAKTSRDANQLGLEGWLVEQHENWLEETALRSAGQVKTEEELLAEFSMGDTKEVKAEEKKKIDDVDTIVNTFSERHPDVEVKYLDLISNILVSGMLFLIDLGSNA
jgi:hypothetical protein